MITGKKQEYFSRIIRKRKLRTEHNSQKERMCEDAKAKSIQAQVSGISE